MDNEAQVNDDMRILLISANRLRAPYPVYPLGVDHVAGALAPRHPVSVLDLCQVPEDELEQAVAQEVAQFGPDMVGISLRNVDNVEGLDAVSFTEHYRRVARAARQAADVPLVLGGAAYTLYPERLAAELGAEYGLAGEGERLPLLLDALERGEEPDGIPGLVVGAKLRSPIAPWQGDPGSRRLLPPERLAFYLERGGMLSLQTKRGCPHRCGYCTYPQIEGHGVRGFDPALAARTARELQEAGARYLWITDASFNCDAEHNLAVARAFRREKVTVPWGAFFAPTPSPTGYWGAMADAGLTHVEFGTESLSPTVLGGYRKPFGVREVQRAHQDALDAGLFVAHYFLLGGPGETRETVAETLSNAETLERAVHFFFCGVRIYAGTRMHQLALQEGQVAPADELLAPVFYRPPGVDLETMGQMVTEAGAGRFSWMLSGGGEQGVRMLERMYARGYTGPLWEKLIRAA